MGRVMNGFCDGCDCLDSNSWGLFCQILGGVQKMEEREE